MPGNLTGIGSIPQPVYSHETGEYLGNIGSGQSIDSGTPMNGSAGNSSGGSTGYDPQVIRPGAGRPGSRPLSDGNAARSTRQPLGASGTGVNQGADPGTISVRPGSPGKPIELVPPNPVDVAPNGNGSNNGMTSPNAPPRGAPGKPIEFWAPPPVDVKPLNSNPTSGDGNRPIRTINDNGNKSNGPYDQNNNRDSGRPAAPASDGKSPRSEGSFYFDEGAGRTSPGASGVRIGFDDNSTRGQTSTQALAAATSNAQPVAAAQGQLSVNPNGALSVPLFNPVEGSDGSLNRAKPWLRQGDGRFGAPRSGGNNHRGIDIPAPVGTPVRPTRMGIVEFNGWGGDKEGYMVRVRHADGSKSTYMHLDGPANRSGSAGFRTPQVNSLVSPQDVIGSVGATGNAADRDAHLHVQVREGGSFVTPNIQGPVTP